MPSERARWVALVAVLGGCSFEWDALRPRVDAGRDVAPVGDVGRDAGATDVVVPTDAGADAGNPADAVTPVDAGDLDAGTVDDAGTVEDVGGPDAGTPDVGSMDAGTPDAGTPDVGTPDVGTPDTGPRDVGTPDTGPADAGTPDAGGGCTGAGCACSPSAPAGWCAIGSTCTSGSCAAGAVAGALVISEVMNDTDNPIDEPDGEWIEVYNPGPSAVNLAGLRVRDAASASGPIAMTTGATLIVESHAYVVLARSPTLGVSGGAMRAIATYDTVSLNNSGTETVTLETSTGTLIDSISYGSGWPNTAGHSKSLRTASLDATMNNASANWCSATTMYATANFGTPGAANDCP